jgi:hypothetical protein
MPVHVQISSGDMRGWDSRRSWCASGLRRAVTVRTPKRQPPRTRLPRHGPRAGLVPLSEHAAPRMPAAHQRRRTACIGQQHIGVHVRAPGDPDYPQAAAPQHIRPKVATSIVRCQEARG